jgi:glutamine cyclotransferase
MTRPIALLTLLGLALAQGIPTYSFKVVATYPHDPNAFTQGLIYHKGLFYEGTGLNGRSEVRKVELTTGKVLQRRAIAQEYFGEGLTLFGGRLYQLTWQSQKGFIYDLASFTPLGSWSYPTEGWGLTHDSKQLIQSDGSANLYFLDPKTLKTVRTLRVTAEGRPLTQLNELEYIEGKIWANIWQTPRIAIIDPQSGRVEAWLDLTPLVLLMPPQADVLNGIAYDPQGKRLFVTGKLWPKLFEIEVVVRP